MPGPRLRAALLGPVAAALAAIGVRLVFALARDTLGRPARFESDRLIASLLDGHGYRITFLGASYRSFHSILPYDGLTLLAYATGGVLAMQLVQALIAALHTLFAGRLGARLGVGAASAWAAALWPSLVYYDACTLSQVGLDATLFTAALLAAVRLRERPSRGRAATLGLVLGLLVHERPTFILMAVLALGWASRWAWRQAVLVAAVIVAVLTPWTVRNAVVHGRLVPLATSAWVNLWKGNNPRATGAELDADGVFYLERLEPGLAGALEGADELAQMETFRAATLAFVVGHPGRALGLYATKLGYFVWHAPRAAALPTWALRGHELASALVLIAIALALCRRPRELPILLIGAVLLYGAVQSFGFIAGRHRARAEVVLAIVGLSAVRLGRRKLGPPCC